VIRYHFDLYPRDDPRDGDRVVRFTKLQAAEYRGEANGTGAGRLSIRADVAEAQLIDPRGLQYVRVVREDTVAVTEAVVGGFWLEQGDFTLLDEQGTRLLSFGGAGTLAYLSRAQMASHTYISPIFTGQDPFDDQWRLYAQSTVYANGNHLGAMLWRVLYEATHNVPGTHKHGDTPAGETVSDTHDDDRPTIAIPDMVFDFDQYVDSDGNDWTQSSGEMKAQVGENVLAVIKRLMEAGLYVEMDPDTFEVRAWENEEHRRTRTGTAWGASVIYFTRPTGEDIDTGNIKSDAKRAIHAYIKRSWLLAGGNDVYGDATGTTDIPWEGFYYADVNDEAAAAGIAAVQIAARDDAGDTLRLRGRLGTDTSNGYYRPFEDALLDDLVTVHTGTDQFDLDDQNFPIAAITVNLRPGGDWDVWYDLGSAYTTTSSRQFQVQPVPAHNHTIPLCEILTPGTETSHRLYWTQDGRTQRTASASWTAIDGGFSARDLSFTRTDTGSSGFLSWSGVDVADSTHALIQGGITLSNAGLLAAVQQGGPFRIQTRIGVRHGVGINEGAHPQFLDGTLRVYRPGTGFIGTMLDVGDGTGLVMAIPDTAGTLANRSMIGVLTGVPSAVATDELVVDLGIDHRAPNTGGAGASLQIENANSSEDLPEDDSTTTQLTSWIELRTTTPASGSGKHPDLTGTSNRAARCDHAHHVIRERAPLPTDDTGEGYPTGTWWVYVDDQDDPTEIIATYLSVDGTNDAAVWLLQSSGADGSDGADGTDLGWFNVRDYDATGDGTTDDQAAINDAIVALNSAGGGVLYFPYGDYLTSGALTAITVPCTVRGDGASGGDAETAYVSRVTCSDGGVTLFDVQSHAVAFENLALVCSDSTPTAGAGIAVTAGGDHGQFRDISVKGFYIDVDVQEGAEWRMEGCYLMGPALYGLKIRHADLPDGGDWAISDTQFIADDRDSTAAIRQESAGGGKITNVKINGRPDGGGQFNFTDGISVVIGTGANSSILAISNSSIENVTGDAIDVSTTGTGVFYAIIVDGIQVGLYNNNTGRALKVTAAAAGGYAVAGGIAVVLVDGLVAITDGTARAAIELTNVDNVTLGEITLMDGFTSRYTQTGSTNISDGGGGVVDLDDLSDVTITAPAEDDDLRYNGSEWINDARKWEAVTDGEDVFVWEGDDLVHDWST
jgi:hypothetical protein